MFGVSCPYVGRNTHHGKTDMCVCLPCCFCSVCIVLFAYIFSISLCHRFSRFLQQLLLLLLLLLLPLLQAYRELNDHVKLVALLTFPRWILHAMPSLVVSKAAITSFAFLVLCLV